MTKQINSKIDEDVLNKFRDVIYHETGLKKGDFTSALKVAMVDYIIKYSTSKSAKDLAAQIKSIMKSK